MQSEHFIFDGTNSADMDQFIVRMSGGSVFSPFFGGQSVQETKMRNKVTPYHFGTETNPITFTIEISPLNREWTSQRRAEIGRWLIHEGYKSFQSADDLGKMYYAIVTEAPGFDLYTNEGFIPFTFRTNSSYAWSPVYRNTYDLSENTGTEIIELNNLSNINRNYRPKLEIKMLNSNGVTLKNLNNNAEDLVLVGRGADPEKGIFLNDEVVIDNENEILLVNREMFNPFGAFNRKWMELVYGVNRIEVTGKCIIETRMQFPMLR